MYLFFFFDKTRRCFENLVEMCLRLRPRVWGTKASPHPLKKTLALPKHISHLTTFVTLGVKPSRDELSFFCIETNTF